MTKAKVKKTAKQKNSLNDGIVADLSEIDKSLTDRAKRFVFFFTFPGTAAFQHKTRSAVFAEYAKKNAVSSGYKLCQNQTVRKEIERLSKTYVSERIESLFNRYVEALENRAFYDVADFTKGNN
jgi:phage terminase small subunit